MIDYSHYNQTTNGAKKATTVVMTRLKLNFNTRSLQLAIIAIFFNLNLLTSNLAYSQVISGTVYEDKNHNQRFDENEDIGLSNILVSNGKDIVATDKDGTYSIKVNEGDIVFVIKPSDYTFAQRTNNTPLFYYAHKPAGSVPNLKYETTPPTPAKPAKVNFPLYYSPSNRRFKFLVFGDPQPYNDKQLNWYKESIVENLQMRDSVLFGLSLGDLVGDKLEMLRPYADITSKVGLPWYNVMGNHDMNLDAKEDEHSDETFEAIFGPTNYSFNYGKAHIIILDDILYPDPRDGKGYWGGFRNEQMEFLKNDLERVPKDHLVIIAFHIPLFHKNSPKFDQKRKDELFKLLKPFDNRLILSAHTHKQQQFYYGKTDNWNGTKELHEFNVGTTCGDWFSGTYDENGWPFATMRDGTPRGYVFMEIDGNQYSADYQVYNKTPEYQFSVFMPKVISKFHSKARCVVNLFMGGKHSQVTYKIDDKNWHKMNQVEETDINYYLDVYSWDEATIHPFGKRPSNPEVTDHIWAARLPENLSIGEHTITIKTIDDFGKTSVQTHSFSVQPKNLKD